MSSPVLLIEREPGLAVFTMNRPEAMNALSRELRGALAQAFAEAEADPDTRVVILTGAGRAFTAGLDLKELGSGQGPLGSAAAGGDTDPLRSMGQFSGPIIGAINGVAVTGGFEVALGCDVLIASRNARFADTHARVGIMPGWGLSQRLSRAIGIYRAKELSLTGNYLDADKAERWGLVNRVVEPDELLDTCKALARDMLSLVPECLVTYKRMIDEGFDIGFGEALQLERKLAAEANRSVTAAAIEQRRAGVRDRGRAQTGSQ